MGRERNFTSKTPVCFLVENHQRRQQQIIQVQDEIQRHNIALLEIIQKLGSVRGELDLCLTQAKVELKAIQYATECKPIKKRGGNRIFNEFSFL